MFLTGASTPDTKGVGWGWALASGPVGFSLSPDTPGPRTGRWEVPAQLTYTCVFALPNVS